jgi:tetratricopeptide (TPR) repeat protein
LDEALYEMADSLVQINRNREALEIYNRIADISPPSPYRQIALSRAANLYIQLSLHEEALRNLRGRIARDPNNLYLYQLIGNIYADQGSIAQAEEAWAKIIQISPDDPNAYRLLASAYLSRGIYEKGIEAYRKGRAHLGQDDLFAQELANMYQVQMRYPEAVEEYIKVILSSSPGTDLGWLEGRLLSISDGEGGFRLVEEKMVKALSITPNSFHLHKILGSLYLRVGRAEEGLNHYREANRIARGNGEFYMKAAGDLEREKRYGEALEAYRAFLSDHPEGASAKEALLKIGELGYQLKSGGEALKALTEFIRRYPTDARLDRAYFLMAENYLYNLKDHSQALRHYQIVANSYSQSAWAKESGYKIGETYFLQGSYDKAIDQFRKLSEATGYNDYADRIEKSIGDSLYEKGDFAGAITEYGKFIDGYKDSLYLNEVLERVAFLKLNSGSDDELMATYVKALRYLEAGQYDRAIVDLGWIAGSAPTDKLADDALLQVGRAHFLAGRHRQAIEELSKLISDYPESPLLPQAQDTIGDIYAEGLGDYDRAIEEYLKVLNDYPDTFLANEIREKIARLRKIKAG